MGELSILSFTIKIAVASKLDLKKKKVHSTRIVIDFKMVKIFLKIFWVLIFQFFRGKSNIVVCKEFLKNELVSADWSINVKIDTKIISSRANFCMEIS